MVASEKRLLGSRWVSAALIHHGANSLFCRQFRPESEDEGGGAGVLEAKNGGGMSIEKRVGASQIKLSGGEGGRNKRAGDVRRKNRL